MPFPEKTDANDSKLGKAADARPAKRRPADRDFEEPREELLVFDLSDFFGAEESFCGGPVFRKWGFFGGALRPDESARSGGPVFLGFFVRADSLASRFFGDSTSDGVSAPAPLTRGAFFSLG